MSDLLINWRFGTYHLQVYFGKPFIRFAQNPYHLKNKPEKWFERY